MTDTIRYLDAPPPEDYDTPTPNPVVMAERAVLGACLLDKRALDDTTQILTPDRFYEPRHELIYDTILHLYSRGLPVEPLTVCDQLGKHLPRAGGMAYILELPMAPGAMTTASATYHAGIVDRAHAARRLDQVGTRLKALALTDVTQPDADIDDLIRAAGAELDAIPRSVPGVDTDTMPGLTIDELLNTEDPEYDWLIPGFLERRDRLILTGGEGAGKSTLLRQIGIQAASGIHPWTLDPVNPIRVLIIDLENSKSQNRRAFRSLRFVAGQSLANGQMVVHSKLDGLDLTTAADEAWLDRMLTYHRPDLLITGPIYKLAGGNPNDEKDAKPAAMALDRIRDRHNVGLILEAHSRKGETNNPKHRPKEPFGWSGWMRWPEFGFHIDLDGDFTPWRGKRDRDREFPTHLKQGGAWPWNPIVTLADQEWLEIRRVAEAAGQRLSVRELARRLDTNEATLRRRIAGREMGLEAIYARAEIV